jgi:hypothetical protein
MRRCVDNIKMGLGEIGAGGCVLERTCERLRVEEQPLASQELFSMEAVNARTVLFVAAAV